MHTVHGFGGCLNIKVSSYQYDYSHVKRPDVYGDLYFSMYSTSTIVTLPELRQSHQYTFVNDQRMIAVGIRIPTELSIKLLLPRIT